jgi:hypothetical protein
MEFAFLAPTSDCFPLECPVVVAFGYARQVLFDGVQVFPQRFALASAQGRHVPRNHTPASSLPSFSFCNP